MYIIYMYTVLGAFLSPKLFYNTVQTYHLYHTQPHTQCTQCTAVNTNLFFREEVSFEDLTTAMGEREKDGRRTLVEDLHAVQATSLVQLKHSLYI